jgi:hypothetical protein
VQVNLTSTPSPSAINAKSFPGARSARRKFLHCFPEGFTDETYLAWERNYKWEAHRRWTHDLNQREMERLLAQRAYSELARRAIQIESRTNLLFSFEKMALRDAVRTPAGARRFATGLRDFLFERESAALKFNRWCEAIALLPRKQTRVLTWPVATVFGFLALPAQHIFLKPMVTRKAAEQYGFPFQYQSRPNWNTYASVLEFAGAVRRDLRGMHPRDLIDIQSFLWVQGSDEYD